MLVKLGAIVWTPKAGLERKELLFSDVQKALIGDFVEKRL